MTGPDHLLSRGGSSGSGGGFAMASSYRTFMNVRAFHGHRTGVNIRFCRAAYDCNSFRSARRWSRVRNWLNVRPPGNVSSKLCREVSDH